jgi:hypothetical protein
LLERLAARAPNDAVVLYEQALALHAAGHDEDALRQSPKCSPGSRVARCQGPAGHPGALGREEGGSRLRRVAQADRNARRPPRHGAHPGARRQAGRLQFEKERRRTPTTSTRSPTSACSTSRRRSRTDGRPPAAPAAPNASARAHRWYGEI